MYQKSIRKFHKKDCKTKQKKGKKGKKGLANKNVYNSNRKFV